jgi:mannose-6-phosphate isomerase class I
LTVVDFRELTEPRLQPLVSGPVRTFDPGVDDFVVTDIVARGDVSVSLVGPCVALVIDGDLTLTADSELHAVQGDALFIEAGETLTAVTGDGRIVLAHSPAQKTEIR